jgi:hypothetical protein
VRRRVLCGIYVGRYEIMVLADADTRSFSANSPIRAHYGVLSTGQPRLPRGGCSKLEGNHEVPKDTHSNGLLCYENVHNHMSFTTIQISQMMLNKMAYIIKLYSTCTGKSISTPPFPYFDAPPPRDT